MNKQIITTIEKFNYHALIALLIVMSLSSCSNSPEKAIAAMKEKADEYMLAGKKPTGEMIVADCSDYFNKDFKNDIKWMSKLKVFETELMEHINSKSLFDTTKKFPETIITNETLERMNDDTAYYYLHTKATFENVVYINQNGENSVIGFLTKDNSGKILQTKNHLSIDIPWNTIISEKVIGTPYARVYNNDVGSEVQPWDYYFYDNKTNHFDGIGIPYFGNYHLGKGLYKAILQISKNDTAKREIVLDGGMVLDNKCTSTYFRIANDNFAGLINDEQAQEQINEKFSDNDYYVWVQSEDKRFVEPIGDILTVVGTYENGSILNAKIVKKEPGFDLSSLRVVNFRTGKLIK